MMMMMVMVMMMVMMPSGSAPLPCDILDREPPPLRSLLEAPIPQPARAFFDSLLCIESHDAIWATKLRRQCRVLRHYHVNDSS